jgi:RES domain-containing protein
LSGRRIVRIVHQKYKDTPYSGEGGFYASGRWHRQGRLVSYAAESLSLATLEILAGAGSLQRLQEMVYVPAHLDSDAVKTLSSADLPSGWDRHPPGAPSRDVGDAWLESAETVALEVPSVLFPEEERNYVLNPAHPHFEDALSIENPSPLRLDPRILERFEADG